MKRKVCYILDAATRVEGAGEEKQLSKSRLPPTDNQWGTDFIDRQRGLHAEMAESSLTDVLKLVMVV